MTVVVIALAWGLGLLVLFLWSQRWRARMRSRERMFAAGENVPASFRAEATEEPWFLARWLSLAGFRAPGAVATFLGLNLLGLCLGLVAVYFLYASGTVDQMVRLCAVLPGAVGDLLGMFASGIPWMLFLVVCVFPWLVLHDARKKRVQQIEQDLPVFLELLATLSESGLGFDAALARILDAQDAGRPLAAEFRTFQLDVLAGRRRVLALRRLARRVDVTPLTILVSALVQAEQVGSGVAEVLRRQSDDLRDRRRERAIALASSLPVKILFPLIICFLPGIAVFTLGPIFFQLFKSTAPFTPPGGQSTRPLVLPGGPPTGAPLGR